MLNKTITIKLICFSILLGISLLWCTPEEEVIVLTKSGVIHMPKGKTEANLHEIQAPENMMNVFQSIQVLTLRKGMPNFNPTDTAKVAPDGNIARLPDFSNLYVLRLPTSFNRDSAVVLLENLPDVIYGEKNQTGEPLQVFPNDDSFPKQWNLNNTGQTGGTPDADIDAPEAWEYSTGSNSYTLGIIDVGVDATHVDLSGKVFGDVGYSEPHGTHVAGIAAAKTNNGDGIAGVDWYARINSQNFGVGTIPEFTQAVIDAVNAGSNVINCSWAIPDFSYTLYDAFTFAYQMGVLPVAALPYSNRNWENPNGFGPWILAVNASNNQDLFPGGIYLGKEYTDIAAPGVDILSTVPGNSYAYMSGTSMAAPHATGVAGLLLAAKPSLKNYDLEWIMKLTAEDVNYQQYPGWDEYMGYGRLNTFEAVKRVRPPYQIIRGTPNDMTLIASNIQRQFLHPPRPDLGQGYYMCDIYKIDITRTFTPGFEEAPLGWFSLTGFSLANPNPCREYIYRDAGVNNITLRTYFYWIRTNLQNGQTINKWAPVDPNMIQSEDVVLGKRKLQPDLQIKRKGMPSYIGDNIYNNDGGSQKVDGTAWTWPAVYYIKIQNDGDYYWGDEYVIHGTGNVPDWDIRYFHYEEGSWQDITQDIVDGTYQLLIGWAAYDSIKLVVTPQNLPHGAWREDLVTATSIYDPNKIDAVKAITKVRNPRIIEDPVVAMRATGPNQGGHLDRVVNSDNLHMIYEGDEAIYHTCSPDNGESWFDEEQEDGWFPCVSINSEELPWVASVKNGDLICQVKRPDGTFKEILIFDGNDSIWAGPPSMRLATMPIKEGVKEYAYITYPVYKGKMSENPMPQPPENITYSYIYVTFFDTIDAVTHLIDEGPADMPVSHSCVGVTPADLIHIAWQQKDEIWYITNAEKITPENWKDVKWTLKYNLSNTSEISEHPFVESYGDIVYVVWKEGNPGEIIRKQRYVWEPSQYDKWTDPENLSNSLGLNSDYPQMSTDEVTLWQEAEQENEYKVYANIHGEIQCLTPDAKNVSFVNCNALVIDPKVPQIEVYYCYTDEVTQDSLYEVMFDKYLYQPQKSSDEGVVYYNGKLGNEITSPYCQLRTGYINYGNYKIDYGNNRLQYLLRYLNPCKHYLFQMVLYHRAPAIIRQRLRVEDSLALTMNINPSTPETLNIFIRPNSYKEDLEAGLEIARTQGAFGVLADFKIYEYEFIDSTGHGSGSQSPETKQLPIITMLKSPKPNPFTNHTEIKFQTQFKSNCDLKIYNSSGSLVKTLISATINPGYYTLVWNGNDQEGRTQPKGIYFVRLKTKDYDATKKMVLVR